MKKYRSPYLNDPEDLGQWSSGAFHLYLQMDIIDFARRYYKRQGDRFLMKRSKELKKIMNQISELQTQAVRALIPTEIIHKRFEYQQKSNEKFGK